MKELREDRRPADLWFWSDWFASFDVRACSLAAQGLWINMLGIMSRSDKKGFLSINGKPLSSKDLAKIVGAPPNEVEALLVELEYYEVFSRLEDGTIFNRRMKKERELGNARAEAGRKGALSRWQTDGKGIARPDGKRIATLESDNDNSSFLSLKEEVLNLWNGFAERHRLPAIKSILPGSKREHALGARMEDKAFDLRGILTEIERSPFLMGRKVGSDFKATFDWIIAPSNYQKIIEGNYRGSSPVDGAAQWLKDQEAKDGGE
jgi:hypothetical protein